MDKNPYSLSITDSNLLKLVQKGNINLTAFEEDILVLESYVAGTSYQNLEDIEIEIILKKTVLTLIREPKNEYDKFAIAVNYKDSKLGYLPKVENQTIARLMDAGKQFYAKAINKEWEGKWLRIELEVYMKD